jgi:hypothetical protein
LPEPDCSAATAEANCSASGADPDQGQDAGADDRPDAERDEVRPVKGLGEPMMLGHVLTCDDRFLDVPILHRFPPLSLSAA